MQRKIVCILVMLCAVIQVGAQETYKERAQQYVERYKEWAMSEQRRSGVPAAITLAQGIHETSGGQSELAANANNHFGIKCRKDWKGQTYSYTDDAPDECFRKYDNVLESYRDHSDYLTGSPRYAALFKLPVTDYKGWATGLKRCGYATNPKYAIILARIVEDFNLQEFTIAAMAPPQNAVEQADPFKVEKQPVLADVRKEIIPEEDAGADSRKPFSRDIEPDRKKKIQVSYGNTISEKVQDAQKDELPAANTAAPVYGALVRVNDLKALYVKKGTVLLNAAIQHKIRYAKLLELNDLPDEPLEADMYIYLEKKHTTGDKATHTVAAGETLLQIAQAQGMQLKYLKAYNKIGGNEEPVAGAVLQLMDYATDKPQTYAKSIAPKESAVPVFDNEVDGKKSGKDNAFISKQEIPEKKEDLPAKMNVDRVKDIIAPIKQTVAAKFQQVVAATVAAVNKWTPPDVEPIRPEAEIVDSSFAAPMDKKPEAETVATTEPASKVGPGFAAAPAPEIKDEKVVVQTIGTNTSKPDSATVLQSQAVVVEPPTPQDTMVVAAATKDQDGEEEDDPVNVADEVAVEELINQAHKEAQEDPDDAFARLKARLDKVVYANEVPSASEKKDELKKEVADVKKGKAVYHTVKKGDTAFGISKKYNISMKQLMEWNDLDFQTIKLGQQLRVK